MKELHQYQSLRRSSKRSQSCRSNLALGTAGKATIFVIVLTDKNREETPFGNSARKDGLILRHWRRKGDVVNGGSAMPVTPADSNAASEMEQDDKATPAVPDSYWAKYNVKVERPQYTDEQYETHLKSENWSKEETDYLVDLAIEFDLRWVVISDRYDYKPSEKPKTDEDSMAVTLQAKPRTQEDMKARYYDVAAKTMVLHNPLSSMSSTEFDAHEKMTKYDPIRETQRKHYAEQLMHRTKEEKDEEEYLLRELSRIVSSQERLSQERKALYDRLEAAPSSARADSYSTTMYQTSQGLTQLMQNLLTQNKNKELEKKEKRRSLLEGGEAAGPSFHPMDRSQRQSLSSAPHSQRLSDATGRRPLTQQEQKKYGVSHPNERLTGGIQFRHERITKAGQAKSGVQTSRIGAALTELKIPPRLVMPTAKVVTEYERLIESIKHLLEVRKVSEKVEGEIKVLVAQKELSEAKDRGEEIKQEEGQPGGLEEGETQNEGDNGERDGDDNHEDEDKDAEGEKEDSDEEVGREESDNDEDEDAEGEVDENVVADEARDLQGDEDAEGDDQEDGEGEEDENMEDEDAEGENDDEDAASSRESPAPTTKSEGMHKRSASVMSHVSNRSSKRQKK